MALLAIFHADVEFIPSAIGVWEQNVGDKVAMLKAEGCYTEAGGLLYCGQRIYGDSCHREKPRNLPIPYSATAILHFRHKTDFCSYGGGSASPHLYDYRFAPPPPF